MLYRTKKILLMFNEILLLLIFVKASFNIYIERKVSFLFFYIIPVLFLFACFFDSFCLSLILYHSCTQNYKKKKICKMFHECELKNYIFLLFMKVLLLFYVKLLSQKQAGLFNYLRMKYCNILITRLSTYFTLDVKLPLVSLPFQRTVCSYMLIIIIKTPMETAP